jgi:hypothetical protein
MKCVDIEKLLHWAYRDELPKQSVAFGVGGRPALDPPGGDC